MAYTPTEWVSGTIISASKLNNIERGIESVNSEYTPTTWAEGDTVTAAKLNKIEQGIADASGGGDFTTANVTVTMAENEWSSSGTVSFASDEDVGNRYWGVFLYNDGTFDPYGPRVEPNGSTTITAVWVGDSTVVSADQHIASVSGSVAIIEDGVKAIISGDCTINLDTNWE